MIGCQKDSSDDNRLMQEDIYFSYIDDLDYCTDFLGNVDEFDIGIITNPYDNNEYRQDIIIDNSNIDLYNIEIIAKVFDGVSYSYPSLGVLEDERFVISSNPNSDKGIYRGVNLSAITTNELITVELMIRYYTEESLENLIVRYIKIDNEIR